MGRGRPAERDDQGARDARGMAGDRASPDRRHKRQYHAAVLARALPAGRRGVCAGPRSAAQSRAGDRPGRIGRVVLRESRRYGSRPSSRREGRGTLWPARQDCDRERAACLRLVPRVAARAAVAVARGGGGEAPALAVGQHRHQGPSLFGCPLRGFADRRGHDKHVTASDAPVVRRPRHRARSPSRRRRGRAARHG